MPALYLDQPAGLVLEGNLSANGTVEQFLGIPYALSPVRWAPPMAYTLNGTSEVRQSAQEYKPACMQRQVNFPWFPEMEGIKVSEDCLYLNVFRPAYSSSTTGANGTLLPILVWLHGGGFAIGAPQQPSNDPELLVLQVAAIVVTVSYRLGPFGFLALRDLAEEAYHFSGENVTGNYGLQDQQLALQWIVNNSQALGGDRDRITLFGESAGGTSVCAHLVKRTIRFRGAMISSAACQREQFISPATALERGDNFATALNCSTPANATSASRLRCLRDLSGEQILDTIGGKEGLWPDDLSIWYPALWEPYWRINSSWPAVWENGQFADDGVNVWLGSTRDEAAFLVRVMKLVTNTTDVVSNADIYCLWAVLISGADEKELPECAHLRNISSSSSSNSSKQHDNDYDGLVPVSVSAMLQRMTSSSIATTNTRAAADGATSAANDMATLSEFYGWIDLYNRSDPQETLYETASVLLSDRWLNCPLQIAADQISKRSTTYVHWLVHRPPQQDSDEHPGYLSCHGTDLTFFFGNDIWLWDFPSASNQQQHDLRQSMMDSFKAFVHTDPSTADLNWPPWTAESRGWVTWNTSGPIRGFFDRADLCTLTPKASSGRKDTKWQADQTTLWAAMIVVSVVGFFFHM
jgi:carboxylesterase type B